MFTSGQTAIWGCKYLDGSEKDSSGLNRKCEVNFVVADVRVY